MGAAACPALIAAPGAWTGRTGAEMFEAMKCLPLGAEVAERSCFSQFSLARVVSPGGKAAASQFVAFPKIQQLFGELAAPLSHLYPLQCSGVLGLHFSLCSLLGAAREGEEPEERSGVATRMWGRELCSHQ